MKTLWFSGKFIIALAILTQLFGAGKTNAQSRIVSSIQKESRNATSGYGRDFWFAIPLNYSPTDRSTKYFSVYVSAFQSTVVNFQIDGGPVVQKPVTLGKVAIFTSPTPKKPSSDLPLSTELYSSGIVEQKAIHIWSDDADLSVNFLSRRDFSSGGMYVIPTVGWGKEYIVGAYESIFDPTGQADWPSEFVVVSNHDSTVVTITPNWDIRQDGFPSRVEHAKQIPFTVLLNKGECAQYQTVLPINDNECDLTGSLISSNNPIGVIGCSVDPYIPFPYGYADNCLSMLQPVRTWSDTYLTSPFSGRTYGGDVYCVIATKKQTIYRNGAQAAVVNFKGDHYFIYDDVVASPAAIWTSDAPFELMQYIPSATFGTGDPLSSKRNQGDADMCCVNSADQYRNDVLFQIPIIDLASGQTEFTNYVNILLPTNHEFKTTYDGIPLTTVALSPDILKIERLPIPNTSWEAVRLTYKANLGEGAHRVISDTGVGVYIYGYGTDDSYSWSGNLGIATIKSIDTIPPTVSISGTCFSTRVIARDILPTDSKLNSIVTDSVYNMSLTIDPSFTVGAGIDTSFYDLQVIDITKEAFAAVAVYDMAGNRTTVKSIYTPKVISFDPPFENYGVGTIQGKECREITITNTGKIPFSFAGIHLSLGNQGFIVDSTVDSSAIPIGAKRIVKICLLPKNLDNVSDTLEISDGCATSKMLLFGSGGQPDFTLSGHDFLCIDIGTKKTDTAVLAFNKSKITTTIDSITTDDPLHFTFTGPLPLPILIGSGTSQSFLFSFVPDKVGNFSTVVHIHSVELGWRTADLTGCGQIPASVGLSYYSSSLSTGSAEYAAISSKLSGGNDLAMLPPVPNPVTTGGKGIRFIFGMKSGSALDLSIYDILGNLTTAVVHQEYQSAGIYEINFPLGTNMPSGTYIYRLSGVGTVISGKLEVIK
jgi:hypothetical protein